MANPSVIVTTSWDDGHELDLRVAELLEKFGLRGTFYVAWNYPKGPALSRSALADLRAGQMEIGSHTFTHRLLTGRPRVEVLDELRLSKESLEDVLGEEISALSYPEGRFNKLTLSCVRESGYRLARTTKAFQTALSFDPLRMPLTVQ